MGFVKVEIVFLPISSVIELLENSNVTSEMSASVLYNHICFLSPKIILKGRTPLCIMMISELVKI